MTENSSEDPSTPDPDGSSPDAAGGPPSRWEPSPEWSHEGWARLSHSGGPAAGFSSPVPVEADLVHPARPPGVPRRRRSLPAFLFLATVASTFYVGCTWWSPSDSLAALLTADAMPVREVVLENWRDGMIYAVCVLLILGSHEMGHFLATIYYRVPASFPYFIPTPFTPIGTMGAVIGMDGRRADRKEVFDIGVAGPLAGLVFAIPIMYYGATRLEINQLGKGGMMLDLPLLVQWMLAYAGPDDFQRTTIWLGELKGNPWFMAGWFGLLITGLNMMPVGQLDGGHVTYTVFGRHSRWMARVFMFAAASYVVYFNVWIWMLMLILVLMMGLDHPPTRDDRVRLGTFRRVLGVLSLSIPVLCFPIRGIIVLN